MKDEANFAVKNDGYFDYAVPTSLPFGSDARLTGFDGKGVTSFGYLIPFDTAIAATDETAADFTVDVFEEFMNCAVSYSNLKNVYVFLVVASPYTYPHFSDGYSG